MCGIAGIITSQPETTVESLLEKMNATLSRRGPDDSGKWITQSARAGGVIGLAHTRLSIIDLSKAGHQPMHSANGQYTMSYNGEIYNFLELKKELSDYPFKSNTDSEVLLAGFCKWGIEETLKRINGMFAIALWSHKDKQLHLIRDRVGIKPIYWYLDSSEFVFASELKAIKSVVSEKLTINQKALGYMLRYKYIPAPFSIYNNCMKLEPGTHLVLDTESFKVNLEKYWQSTPAKIECSFEDATKRLDKLLNDAVVRRMVSDVPIGAMLSGGIDSSLVCAIMQKNSATKINSFSIGFHEKEYNEAPYAKAIAEHLGTQHTQLYLQAYDIKDTIPSMVDVFDEPFSDPSQIPTFMISKLIKKHVTVCLSGDGGDELFLGYQRYEEAQRRYSYINRVPAPIRKPVSKAILSIATLLKHDGGKVLARHINSRDIYQLYDQLLSDWHRDSKILNDVQTLPKIEGLTLEKDSSLEQLAYLDYNYYLPDDILTKVDRTSMWHSLELRVPLLDHTVVEYAHSLPIDKKIRDGSQKALLKALLKQYIPEKLFLRPKMGFAIPIDHWLKTDLKDWGGDLLNSNNAKEYLNHRLIKKMWEAHQNNAGQWHFPLWNILMFLAWKEAV